MASRAQKNQTSLRYEGNEQGQDNDQAKREKRNERAVDPPRTRQRLHSQYVVCFSRPGEFISGDGLFVGGRPALPHLPLSVL